MILTMLYPVRKTIYNALTASTALMALVTGVYDDIPDETAFPYIIFEGVAESRNDRMADYGSDIRITLCVWSKYKGMSEAEEILKEMNNVLDYKDLSTSLSTDINYWEMCRWENTTKIDMNDGFTRGLAVSYRCLVS